MNEFLEHPAVQGGVAPFVVALIVAVILGRTRYAWLAVVAGYVTAVALSTGIAFEPLTATRKVLVLTLVVAVAGIVLDALAPKARTVTTILAAVAGLAAVWVFWTVLAQREGGALWTGAAAVAVFAGVMALALMSLRDDPVRVAAATRARYRDRCGRGPVGVDRLPSRGHGGRRRRRRDDALWVITSRTSTTGFLGTLTVGIMIALFAEGASLLAQMPWYATLSLLLIPLAVRLPVGEDWGVFKRAFVLTLYALAAASVPIAAAWFAARATPS